MESHARRTMREDYVAVPEDDHLIVGILAVLHLPPLTSSSSPQQPLAYRESRDCCGRFTSAPVYRMLPVDGSRSQPLSIIAITKSDYVLCCLPLTERPPTPLEDENTEAGPRVPFGDVTVVLDLLESIAKILDRPSSSINSRDQMCARLDAYLDVAAPLGRLIETDFSVIDEKLAADLAVDDPLKCKQPAWKPVVHRGRSQVCLSITEFVRLVQFDRIESPVEVLDIHGSIQCTALLEAPSAEVTLTVAHEDSRKKLGLQNVIFHPCTSAVDSHDSDFYKVRFIPGNQRFVLCSYVVPHDNDDMPVYGVFKLREGDNKTVDFWLQLKLSGRLKNSFEHFEAIIPIFNRGRITHAELRPSWGTTNVSQDRRHVVWSLGYKFPSKNLDASLKGTLIMDDQALTDQLDPLTSFCVGLNCFAEISFKTKSHVYSSCNVDPKSVRVTPASTKFKFTLEKLFESVNCKIWNSYGNVPTTVDWRPSTNK